MGERHKRRLDCPSTWPASSCGSAGLGRTHKVDIVIYLETPTSADASAWISNLLLYITSFTTFLQLPLPFSLLSPGLPVPLVVSLYLGLFSLPRGIDDIVLLYLVVPCLLYTNRQVCPSVSSCSSRPVHSAVETIRHNLPSDRRTYWGIITFDRNAS